MLPSTECAAVKVLPVRRSLTNRGTAEDRLVVEVVPAAPSADLQENDVLAGRAAMKAWRAPGVSALRTMTPQREEVLAFAGRIELTRAMIVKSPLIGRCAK